MGPDNRAPRQEPERVLPNQEDRYSRKGRRKDERTTVSLYPEEYDDLVDLRNMVQVKERRYNMTLNDAVRYALNVVKAAGKP